LPQQRWRRRVVGVPGCCVNDILYGDEMQLPILGKYSVNPSSGIARLSVRAIPDHRVCAYRTDTLIIHRVGCLWSTPLDWLCGRHGEGYVGIRRC
jgi:hypothetical protein